MVFSKKGLRLVTEQMLSSGLQDSWLLQKMAYSDKSET